METQAEAMDIDAQLDALVEVMRATGSVCGARHDVKTRGFDGQMVNREHLDWDVMLS